MNSFLMYEKEPHGYNLFKIYALKRYMEERNFLKLRDLSLNKFFAKNMIDKELIKIRWWILRSTSKSWIQF